MELGDLVTQDAHHNLSALLSLIALVEHRARDLLNVTAKGLFVPLLALFSRPLFLG